MGKTIHTYLWSDDINGMKQIFIPGDGCVLFYNSTFNGKQSG